jgi:hypothetical protein
MYVEQYPSREEVTARESELKSWHRHNKKTPTCFYKSGWTGVGSDSDAGDFGRLQAFGAFLDLKLNLLAFAQGFEAITTDGLEMHEHVFTAFALDEPETLGLIEPLHDSLFHGGFALSVE